MELQLTNSEKYELIEIDLEELCNEIQREILTRELYLVNKSEKYMIQKAIGDSTELEFDLETPQENTRLSFYSINHQLVVIKRKSINIKMILELLIDTFNFSVGDNGTKIGVILSVLFKTFFDVLDDDIALVYSYLCNEYFINHIKISNIEIYDKVNEYLELNWSNDKINKILLQLENKRVIEFVDGVLKVKDKIYFE